MGMAKNISNFLNSINDKRIASAVQKVMNQTQPIGLDTAITAYAGGGQANARVLRQDCAYHDVTVVATAADSVALPAAMVGEVHFVKNSAALKMQVYAPTPGTIDSVATGTGVVQEPGDGVLYVCVVQGNYIRLGGVQATEAFGDITADNLTMANPIVYDHNTTITAFATGGQASATALTGEFNNVTTCATASDSVKLPAAALGKKITVKNSGATALAVFPASGDAINAMAVNLSVDLAVGGQMTFHAIDGTTWETEEFLISQAPSTQKGSLVVKASDSAGNTVTTVTNASQAAARTYTIPDGGADASFLLTKGAQTIDGVQTHTVPRVLDSNTTITAFATGGQASATALTGEYNTVTVCATANDSVKLPAAVAGQIVTVRNLGAAICAVFPASGDAINALAADLSISLPVLGEMTFEAVDGTTWYTNRAISLPAPTTQRGNLVFKPADNAANYEVSVTNASHGQATVHTIPDPLGATGTVVLEELTNVFDLPQRYDANTTITAFATGGQASATALTGEFNNVTTCATSGDSVKLPTAAAGLKVTVKNSGAASLAVFPATSDSINALAIDLSVNIPVGGKLTFRAIDTTVWETNEVFVSPAPTTQRGEFVFKAADNAADYEVVLTNASHGQATTTTIPDPAGATGTVVLEEVSNLFDLPQKFDHNTTITAFATGGQASATALTGQFNNVTTCATANDSVKLPAAALGQSITVKNSGAASLAVFPATDDAINALAANLSVDIPVSGELTFRAIDATTWETNEVIVLPAPATQNGTLLVKASNNAANYAVTITNASHGQATTHTHPDGGAATDYVVHSTAALTLVEADVLDGAVAANSVASKAALLDSNKRVQTNSNNGTMEAGVTAVFYGDGVNVTAVLTVTNVAITVGNSANLGTGALLFTLPAGACMIRDAYMSIGISGVSFTTDTPDVGLGTVVGSGVVITLDGTPTFENIITGQTATDTNGTATVKGAGPTAGNPLEITTGGAHTVYFNAADGWGANADTSGLLNGTVVISYVRQNA